MTPLMIPSIHDLRFLCSKTGISRPTLGHIRTLAASASFCFLMADSAPAVVVLSGGPNNTAPSGQPFFGNVGTLNGASAIYLGNRWVMTAAHVAGSLPGSVHFGGSNYSTVGGSYERLSNNGALGMSATTDIALFRLSSDPGLPWLSVATTNPLTGTVVMSIGNSRVQESTPTYWNVTVNPGNSDDAWTEVSSSDFYNRVGFQTTGSNEVRWGVNYIETASQFIDGGSDDVRSFTTLFGGSVAFPGVFTHESQAVLGDSGGAVFSLDGNNNWLLSGMMFAVNGYENQPANTAVIGQSTFAADLSFYSNQILSITQIPESSSSSFILLGLCSLLARRKRR